jgi:hypothetical protein
MSRNRTHCLPLYPPRTTAASTCDHVVLWYFHQRLHTLCRMRGLTVTELAQQAGLNPAERRALQEPLLLHDPGLAVAVRLARALRVSLRLLLT